MKTNKELIEELNAQIKSFTKFYFDNLNSCMNPAPKDGNFYEVPGIGVQDVHIHLLSPDINILKIKTSPVVEVVFKRKAISPLVRVEIPLETIIDEWFNDKSYMKASVMGIINSVQKAWEKEFGSYKIERFGKNFFILRDIVYIDNSESIYLDFVGDWASNKED